LTYADLEAIYKYIPDLNDEYSNQREKRGIKKRGLLRDDEFTRKTLPTYHTTVTETKLVPLPVPEIATVMQIYDDKISYIELTPNSMIGVIIENRAMYQLHKSFFEYMWSTIPVYSPRLA
jgi:hypothetical protein